MTESPESEPPVAVEPTLVTEADGQVALAFDGEDGSRVPAALVKPAPHSDERPPSIKRVWIRNFKGYESFDVTLGKFNVLVGANNAGKSTLLQAIDLLYSLLKLHEENHRLAPTGRMVPPAMLPVAALRDLFYNGQWRVQNQYVYATVGAEFTDNSMVEFGIRLMFGNGNSQVRLQEGMEGGRLDALLSHPAVWVPSAVGIVRDEEYRTAARRTGLISAGRHNEVLRNLLVQLHIERPERFDRLQEILKERFKGTLSDVEFNEAIDQFVSAGYTSESGAAHDLFSAGAGFIQVVQLLAFVLSPDASIVLLDEPDAHLHSSLQRVVVEILDEIAVAESMQVVMATHSKEIINFVDPTRLILVENGAAQAEPVNADVTPMTILKSMGDIDNVDAYALVKNRKCIFVEGTSDEAILGRFASTLGVHAFTGDDRVIVMPTGGVDRFEHVRQLDVIESLLGGELKSIQLRDRDCLTDEAREAFQNKSRRPMVVLERDCIESLLIHADVIARAINDIAEERSRRVDASAADISAMIVTATDALRDETHDRVADRLQVLARAEGEQLPTNRANPAARELVAEHWEDLDSRLKFVSGKRLLGVIRQQIQETYGVTFGNERLAETFTAEEIPTEIVDFLNRVKDIHG